MILSPSGLGIQTLFANATPIFVWDAYRAGHSIGKGADGTGHIPLTITDNDSAAAAQWFRFSDGKLRKMSAASDTVIGMEEALGPTGDFFGGKTTSFYGYNNQRLGLTEVAPTVSTSWVRVESTFPDIFHTLGLTTSDHDYVVEARTNLDAVNDVVVERAQSRSATYNRDYTVLVKNITAATNPNGLVEVGYNATAGTRLTSTPTRIRKLPGLDWYAVSFVVPSNATTSGYLSLKFLASTGTWQACSPSFFNIFVEHEYITRIQGGVNFSRGKWDVHTTSAEVQLRRQGWLAMSIILPDKGVGSGHLDYAGGANYKFCGMFNLDCGTDRLRVSMSDTYDYIVVSLGTTSSTYYAYLDSGQAYWDAFAPLGLVVMWEVSSGNKYATLWINGIKCDSVANPATGWFADNLAPGTLYLGVSGADGTPAEASIPRIAYGNTHMHRAYARTLSIQMRNWAMERGGSALDAWGAGAP
jgi:hypothetical protein